MTATAPSTEVVVVAEPVFSDAARRAELECFGRDLEALGRARATIARRLCTVAGSYRYAVEEELLDHSPAHVRGPRASRCATLKKPPPAPTPAPP